MMKREELLAETFVELADTLVDDYDIIDFMQTLADRSVELLDVSAAGIMLADIAGQLHHVACSSEQMRLVELFELQVEEGPCFDAYREQVPVRCDSAQDVARRWPRFAPYVRDSGFVAVSAVPMRLRSQVVGALNLFASHVGALSDEDVVVAQAMADIATIGILQQRMITDTRVFSSQLEVALESRVWIEQAKGVVAEHNGVSVDAAFQLIRGFARSHNRLLSDTARQIVDGTLSPEQLARIAARVERPRTAT
ncbi:MAG: GAF and ANTAR domain-containing protein [Acidimicrobiales bacterium]